jgi:hypothetical protein
MKSKRFELDLTDLEHGFSGGVPRSTIDAAEAAIRLRFPPSYVGFLRSHGSGFIEHHELFGLGGPRHLDVVEETLHLRSRSKISRFPESFIPVLGDGFGNFECLDSSNTDGSGELPVVQWLHDGGDRQQPSVLASSYDQWLRRLVVQIRLGEKFDREAP